MSDYLTMPMFEPYDSASPMPGHDRESEGYDALRDFLMAYVGAPALPAKATMPHATRFDSIRAALARKNPDLGTMRQQAARQVEAFCHALSLNVDMLRGLAETEHMRLSYPLSLTVTHQGMPMPPEDCRNELAQMYDFYAGICTAEVPACLSETGPILRFKDYVRTEILPRISQYMSLYQQFAEDVEAQAVNPEKTSQLMTYLGTLAPQNAQDRGA